MTLTRCVASGQLSGHHERLVSFQSEEEMIVINLSGYRSSVWLIYWHNFRSDTSALTEVCVIYWRVWGRWVFVLGSNLEEAAEVFAAGDVRRQIDQWVEVFGQGDLPGFWGLLAVQPSRRWGHKHNQTWPHQSHVKLKCSHEDLWVFMHPPRWLPWSEEWCVRVVLLSVCLSHSCECDIFHASMPAIARTRHCDLVSFHFVNVMSQEGVEGISSDLAQASTWSQEWTD